MKDNRMIILIIIILLSVIQLANGMVLYEGATATLDHLVQKSLRYEHHKENDLYLERHCTLLYRDLILYNFQGEICTKKDCELIKAVAGIFSL